MEDEAHQRRVFVEVLQFAGHVAVVDVDRHGTDLEACEHAFDVLGTIDQLETDAISGSGARALEVVGKAVSALVQLGVAEPAGARNYRGLRAHAVDHTLEEIGQIEFHGSPRSSMGLPALPLT